MKRLRQRLLNAAHFQNTLTLTFGSLVLGLLLTIVTVGGLYYRHVLIQEENALVTMSGKVVRHAIDRVSFSGRYHTQLLAEELSEELADIVYVRVSNLEGRVVAFSADGSEKPEQLSRGNHARFEPLLRGNSDSVIHDFQYKGDSIKEISLPYYSGYTRDLAGVVSVGISTQRRDMALRDGWLLIGSTMALLTLFSSAIVWWLSRVFGNPVDQARLERELAEERARNANAENRAKSEFLAMMSHEIRTPMNGVLGLTELMQETPLSPEQHRYTEAIRHSGQTLLAIINDLLDVSKINAGRLELERLPVSLLDLVDESIEIFALKSMETEIRLVTDIDPTLPAEISADPVRLRQIVNNFLSNAFKFTDRGEITLQLCRVLHEHKPWLQLSVVDSGIGISEEQKNRLFEAFVQADSSITRRFGGTGLGLNICKRLAELMGGHIGVDSSPGKGSRFWFELPITDEPGPSIFPHRLSGAQILLVSNQSRFANNLAKSLGAAGANCLRASTADQAEACLQSKTVSTVLIDSDLPDANGLDLAEKIRTNRRQYPHIILMSNRRFVHHGPLGRAAKNLDIDAILDKPFSHARLFAALEKQLEKKQIKKNGSEHTAALSFPFLRVLIAEDNPTNQMVIKGMLNQFDIDPALAADGRSAVEWIQNSPRNFDLILMDCEMPILDGYSATRRLRQWEKEQSRPKTLIVGLSAHATHEYRDAALNAGMDDYLTKPVTLTRLGRLLTQHFSNHRSAHI